MSDWHIRAYQSGDEDGISELFERVFGKPLSIAHWQWKLHTLPSPAENEWVAECNGRIVGHYAVTPIRFKVGDCELMVPHGCDAMTHPDFRRRGILSALGERANALWRDVSPFQIGFHYGGWGSVRERLGWRPLVRLVLMRCPLRPMALLARRLGLRNGVPNLTGLGSLSGLQKRSDLCVTHIERAGDEFDHLWQKLSAAYTYSAVRDRAWVRWRYLDMPAVQQRVLLASTRGEPLGYLAYRIQQDAHGARATLLDCLVARDDALTLRALVAHTKRELTRQGIESVSALAMSDSSFYHTLRLAGFWPSKHGFDFSIIPYAQQNFSDAQNWFVTGAEGDVV